MVPTISAVLKDKTLIELVLHRDQAETALIVATDGTISTVTEWQADDQTYVPIHASNNLLKHGALVLASEPTEYGAVETLLQDIDSYIARYLILPAAARGLCSAYILLSWLYDAFNELPYLRFRGDYGTGKTRALLIVGSLCYKAFFASGASTVSPIFHVLNSFQGTLIFDEADFRFSDEKAELTKILNNGNVKGFPLLRTHITAKREFDPRAFSIFGPKIVGMRHAFEDPALESRFLTIDMEPGNSESVPINLPDAQKDEALALRNKLLMYRLHNRISVTLDPGLVDPSLEPRMNQILLPLLSVVPAELHRAVRETAASLQARAMNERAGSTEGQVLSVLASRLLQSGNEPVSLADLRADFVTEYGSDYERTVTNRWIGSILRRLGILLYKRNGVFVVAPGQSVRLRALCERHGIDVGQYLSS